MPEEMHNFDTTDTKVKESRATRLILEKDWFINDLFSEGIHSLYYNPNESSLRKFETAEGRVREIDMFNLILNGLVNSTTKNAPRPEGRFRYGEDISIEKKQSLKATNVFLSSFYENKNVKVLWRDIAKDGFLKNAGWAQVIWDDQDADGLGEINIEKIDSWGVHTDPSGYIDYKTGLFEGEWIIKECVVPIDKVKTNVNYNKKNRERVKEFGAVHPNELKKQVLAQTSNNQKLDNVTLLYELYYRRWEVVSKEVKEGKEMVKKNFQVQKYFRKVFGTDNLVLQDETPLDLDAFPLFVYQAIRKNGSLNVRPWANRIVELNKILDMLLTKMTNQVKTGNVERILKHKTTKTSVITEEDGQVISWEGARPPELMQKAGLSGDLFGFQNMISSMIQDVGMFHVESAGGGGNLSGIALAQKQAGDIFNITEPVENLSVFCGAIFKYIVALANEKYVVTRTVYDDDEVPYKIIGDSSGKNTPKNTVKLARVESVAVKVVPAGVYSDIQKKQDMLELFQLGVVTPTDLLEAYNTGAIGRTMERLEEERMKAQGLTPEVEKAIKLAEKNYASLIKGESVKPVDFNEKKSQLGYFSIFSKEASDVKFEPEIAEALSNHLEKSFDLWGWAKNIMPIPSFGPEGQVQPQGGFPQDTTTSSGQPVNAPQNNLQASNDGGIIQPEEANLQTQQIVGERDQALGQLV